MQRKRKERAEEERERAEMAATTLNKTAFSGSSPSKGVGFANQSQASSPTKFGGSPTKKSMYDGGSEADTKSIMTGGMGAKSPSKFGGLMGMGRDIGAIIASAGAAAKSGLTMDNKNFRKMNAGGAALPSQKSQTGKSSFSKGTGTKSKRSKTEYDFENMEVEQVEDLIEEAET